MKLTLFTISLLFLNLLAFAQVRTVTGTVLNSEREPLEGATVTVNETGASTTTEVGGKYSLAVPQGRATLTISFVGHSSITVEVGSRSVIDVELVSGADESLDDVIVVGYGTAKKATLSGSISTVKGAEVRQAPVTNVTNALIGRMPGVTSIQRTGEPGNDEAQLTIRGVNSIGNNAPLVVVDGVPHRSLARIDPNTIESINVLKDASAAIYGSEAANGVILVTTKRGKAGKPVVSFNLNQAYNRATFIPRMTNSFEYATLLNEIDADAGRPHRYSESDLQKYKDGSDPWRYPNTDWYNDIMKPWSPQRDLGVNVSGGTDRVKYFLALGTKFQDAFYRESNANYKQHNFLSNIDVKLSDYVSVRLDLTGRLQNNNRSMMGAGEIYRLATSGQPYRPSRWPNGLPAPAIGDNGNPVVMGTDAAGFDRENNYILNSLLQVNVKVPGIEGLSLSASAGYDKGLLYRKRFRTPFYLYSWDGVSTEPNGDLVLQPALIGAPDPNLNMWAGDDHNLLLNGILTFDRQFGDHGFKFLAGTERRTSESSRFNAYRRFFLSAEIPEMFAGGTEQQSIGGSGGATAKLNYFGRVNYDFKEKYLLEFLWRYDGSQIFGRENGFGFFPGVSAAWRISEESFWQNSVSTFNELKLRGSWGQTGNDRIAQWQFMETYIMREGSGNLYLFGIDGENQRMYEGPLPNPDVSWEVANQHNIAIDGALLNNKLSFTLEYFNNIRSNMLWFRNATVPGSAGVSLPRENIAKARNRGYEISLGYQNTVGKFHYSISGNIAGQKNKVLFWDEPEGRLPWQKSTGRAIPSTPETETNNWFYDAIGIFKDQADLDKYPHWPGAKPGDIIFRDVNEDGVINGQDRIRIDETGVPTWVAGLNINLSYGPFDLTVLMQGAGGHVRYVFTESGEIGNFLKDFYDNRWTPENPNAPGPRVYNRNSTYWTNNNSTFFNHKADYLRLKTMELGYNLPSSLLRKVGATGMRVYVSGYNLFTLTGLKDFDPESVYTGAFSQSYPVQKVLNFGVNLNL